MEEKYACDNIEGIDEAACENMEQLKNNPDTKLVDSDVFYRFFGKQERSAVCKELFVETVAELDKWKIWNIRKVARFILKKGKELEYQKLKQLNVNDHYGKGTFDYLKHWAAMMEKEMEQGELVGRIAKQTSISADTDGITGAMYGHAVEVLSEYWEYGEQLREWHNSQHSYNGSGVVNPTVMILEKAGEEETDAERMETDEIEGQALQINL